MLKRVICLSAALCMLLSIASADTSQQLQWAIEAAQECDWMAKAAMDFLIPGFPYGALEVLGACYADDRSSPTAVYRFTTDLDIFIMQQLNGKYVTEEQVPHLRKLVMAYFSGTVNTHFMNSQDELVYLARSRTMSGLLFDGECGYEWWLLCYDDGADVLVTFMPYGDGIVNVRAEYWPGNEGPTEVYALMKEAYGFVTCERIK